MVLAWLLTRFSNSATDRVLSTVKSLFWSPVQPFGHHDFFVPEQMFSHENYLSLFLGHQKIGEVKNKCNFANILGRLAEKRVIKMQEK